MSIKLALRVSALGVLLAGCGGNLLSPEFIRDANQRFESLDGVMLPQATAQVAALEALWNDRPQYLSLIHAPPPLRRIRLISGVPPRWPYVASAPNIARTVRISFVVAPNGRVEAARVITSDAEFLDKYAIEAIMMFKFAPARAESGPVRTMDTMNFRFRAREVAPLSACCEPPPFPPIPP